MANRIQASYVGTAASFIAANPILLPGERAYESDTGKTKIGDGATAWGSLAYFNGSVAASVPTTFGDGSDGDVSLSSGTTTLTRDTYYNNLTLSGTAKIITAGYWLFCKDTLDLTNAPADAITWTGNNGSASATTTGGAAGAAQTTTVLAGGTAGGAGGTGVVGVGAQATAPVAIPLGNGGAGGAGGSGGAGT